MQFGGSGETYRLENLEERSAAEIVATRKAFTTVWSALSDSIRVIDTVRLLPQHGAQTYNGGHAAPRISFNDDPLQQKIVARMSPQTVGALFRARTIHESFHALHFELLRKGLAYRLDEVVAEDLEISPFDIHEALPELDGSVPDGQILDALSPEVLERRRFFFREFGPDEHPESNFLETYAYGFQRSYYGGSGPMTGAVMKGMERARSADWWNLSLTPLNAQEATLGRDPLSALATSLHIETLPNAGTFFRDYKAANQAGQAEVWNHSLAAMLTIRPEQISSATWERAQRTLDAREAQGAPELSRDEAVSALHFDRWHYRIGAWVLSAVLQPTTHMPPNFGNLGPEAAAEEPPDEWFRLLREGPDGVLAKPPGTVFDLSPSASTTRLSAVVAEDAAAPDARNIPPSPIPEIDSRLDGAPSIEADDSPAEPLTPEIVVEDTPAPLTDERTDRPETRPEPLAQRSKSPFRLSDLPTRRSRPAADHSMRPDAASQRVSPQLPAVEINAEPASPALENVDPVAPAPSPSAPSRTSSPGPVARGELWPLKGANDSRYVRSTRPSPQTPPAPPAEQQAAPAPEPPQDAAEKPGEQPATPARSPFKGQRASRQTGAAVVGRGQAGEPETSTEGFEAPGLSDAEQPEAPAKPDGQDKPKDTGPDLRRGLTP